MKSSKAADILKVRPSVVESGTTPVDDDLFIPSVGEIDMVGIKGGRLILACVMDELGGRHLKQVPELFRWARDNSKLLAHVYREKGLQEGFSIGIWYLCAEIEPEAQLLLPSMNDLPLTVYRYRPSGRSIAVEKMAGIPKADVIKIPTSINFELSEKELGAFLSSSDEEITYTGPDSNS
jgi:hypothetical protein